MDKLKIENYAKTYPGVPFPTFESLDAVSAERLRDRISEKFGLTTGTDQLAMVKEIDARGLTLEGVDARNDGFNVSAILQAVGIVPSEYVYLNWYRLDDIDRLRLSDLDGWVEDIWYPGSDDLDVFDDSLTWMLSIAHHGAVKLIRP